MYKRILVAIDMSSRSKRVFTNALSLAQKNDNAHLLLLHVLSAEEDNSPLPIPSDMSGIYPAMGNDLTMETWYQEWQNFQRQGEEKLATLAQEATNAQVKVEYRQIIGSPGRMICSMAQDWSADLIVIGRRGRSGIQEILLGSISNYVIHHSHCCTLIVQG